MNRKTRLIVILMLIAAAGIFGLMLVANQYRRAAAPKSTHGAIK